MMKKWMNGLFICALAVGFFAEVSYSQVVIVPSKLRPARSTEKQRPKLTKKTNSKPAAKPEAVKKSDAPISKAEESPEVTPPGRLPEPPAKNAVAPLKIDNYAYKSLAADLRGQIVEWMESTGRLVRESLPGDIDLEIVEVPAGSVVLGEDDVNRRVMSIPAIHVARFEITQAQWRAVAGLPRVKIDLPLDPSVFKGPDRPVENVTWEETIEFCERLSIATGRKFRLPTEAEWEYACRAGSDSPFSFGEAINAAWVNFHGRRPLGNSPKSEFRKQTVPVGSLGLANKMGLFDMHGNVWEMCEEGAARGGAWDSSAIECRSGSRRSIQVNQRSGNVGFRVVAD